jgi:uncharacterized protein YjbI with pentapeptide repeats
MANPDHLALLDRGVEAWNAARREASDLPDLESADLSGRNLSGVNFCYANLQGANLQGCNLEGANLSEAWLEKADLRNARLAHAYLNGATITRWRLEGATLVDPDEYLGDSAQFAALLNGRESWKDFVHKNQYDLYPELPLNVVLTKLERTQRRLAQAQSESKTIVDSLAPIRSDDPFDDLFSSHIVHDLPDETHRMRLLESVEEWNRWRRENPSIKPQLNRVDLTGAELEGANLERADLSGTILVGANLNSANLEQADLSGAILAGANLKFAKLERAMLIKVDLTGAELEGANLASADLSGAILVGANLNYAELSANLCDAMLCWSDLQDANAMSALFDNADLTGANLTHTRLSNASFEGANLTGANLNRAHLSEARLENADLFEGNAYQLARFYQGGKEWNEWRKGTPEGPDLRGVNLGNYFLWDEDLSGGYLARAYLGRISGSLELRLAGADLTAAILSGANFYNADLEGTNFVFATLVGAELGSAKLANADFTGADLSRARLGSSNLSGARLYRAVLTNASLYGADCTGVDLTRAILNHADLNKANLTNANLTEVFLYHADLTEANLTNANLTEANLSMALLVGTILDGATLTSANVYGVAAWGLDLSKVSDQTNLYITPEGRDGLTIDNLELAQFVYLMVHNEKIRGIIDTIGRKAVLLLGRFYAERKAVLDALKAKLRECDLVPIVFDWDKPACRDLTETVALLANMSRFVVADVTDAKSIPQELSEIVPRLPSVPVQPILLHGDPGYAMFEHWKGYSTMLPVFVYHDQAHLLDQVHEAILAPVEAWEAGNQKQSSLEDELKAKDLEIERLRAMLQAKSNND